jgi:hypothetical protein
LRVVFGRVMCLLLVSMVVRLNEISGRIAQSVERSANNAVVLGSSPSMTNLFYVGHQTIIFSYWPICNAIRLILAYQTEITHRARVVEIPTFTQRNPYLLFVQARSTSY